MMRAVLAATLAAAGLITSVNTASAACTYGSFSVWSTTMNASFNSGYAECSVTNLGITFRARTFMHGTCQLGKGCRSASVRRSDTQCGWLGIGAQVRANKVNYATGVITPDSPLITTPNSWGCNHQITQSQPAPDNWLLGVRCRIGTGC